MLNNCLKNITHAEKCGKRQVLIRPSSKVVIKFLQVMQKHSKLNSSRDMRVSCLRCNALAGLDGDTPVFAGLLYHSPIGS